jgi:hypothetical protein
MHFKQILLNIILQVNSKNHYEFWLSYDVWTSLLKSVQAFYKHTRARARARTHTHSPCSVHFVVSFST